VINVTNILLDKKEIYWKEEET